MKVMDKTNTLLIAELKAADSRRIQAEEELQESEEFNTSLLENLPNVVLITKPDTSIRYVNPALENLTGFTSLELIGQKTPYPWWIWGKSPGNADNPANTIANRVRGFEFYRKKNGETFWAEVTSVPIKHHEELRYYLSSWVDITEHKRAEKQVIELNTFYKKILDSIINGILVTDKNDAIIFSNKGMGAITGISPEIMFGKTIMTDILENSLGFSHTLYYKAKNNLQPLYYDTIPAVTPDGRKMYQSGWLVPIVVDGNFNGMIGTVEDITGRLEIEKNKLTEQDELSKLKSDILAKVSHQLRSPLAAIKGYATMMLDYEPRLTSQEKRTYLQAIDSTTSTLTELVSQLLDISHLEAGLVKLNKKTADISGLLEETAAEARLRAPGHNIVCNQETWLPKVKIDAIRIKQVIENLTDNACKYSRDGTEVVISARRIGQSVIVSVADKGIGIPAGELEKVFNQMYRAEKVSSHNTEGLGLGLAICKEIVEAHGGKIWAESQEGNGSIFYFTVPIQNHAGKRS